MSEALNMALAYLLLDTPWYLMACVPFMNSLRIRRKMLLVLVIGTAILRTLSVFLLVAYVPDWRSYESALYIAYYIVLIAMFLLAFRVSPARLIYVFLLVYALSTGIDQITAGVLRFIFPDQRVSISVFPLLTAAEFAITLLLFPWLYRFFKGRLRQAVEGLDTKSILMLCITPAVFAVAALVLVAYISAAPSQDVGLSVLNFLFSVAGIASYFVNLWMLWNGAEQVRKESALHTQLALQAQGYENLTQRIEAARISRHDLRHHLNVIQDYAGRKDNEGLLSYLAEYTAALPSDDVPDYCDNPTVNVLLRHYLTRAAAAGAALDVKIGLRAHAGIPDADLCVVFGNLFENAAKSMEAQTSGEKFIRARCDTGEGDIVLTLENSVGEAAPGEGVGLKSVTSIAKKYEGSARFERHGQIWSGSVLLPIPQGDAPDIADS